MPRSRHEDRVEFDVSVEVCEQRRAGTEQNRDELQFEGVDEAALERLTGNVGAAHQRHVAVASDLMRQLDCISDVVGECDGGAEALFGLATLVSDHERRSMEHGLLVPCHLTGSVRSAAEHDCTAVAPRRDRGP